MEAIILNVLYYFEYYGYTLIGFFQGLLHLFINDIETIKTLFNKVIIKICSCFENIRIKLGQI